MKKIALIALIFANIANLNARVFTNDVADPMIIGSNVIIDGSTAFSIEAGAHNNIGAGIILPSVDLIDFEFDLTLADGITFPTFFDGLIVYNRASSTEGRTEEEGPLLTRTDGNRSSTAVEVEPGFYYFSNPNGASDFGVTNGVWVRIGGGSGSISPNPIMKITANEPLVAEEVGDDVNISLKTDDVLDGSVLVFNADENKWEPKSAASGEHIWLPAINLPWNLAGDTQTVDLFAIYQQSFMPGTAGGGVPNSGGTGIMPTSYGVNYASSTGAFRSLGREADEPTSFDYVVTYYDNSIVTITSITPQGKLTYKPTPGTIPSANAFISVLLIRK